MQPTHRNETEIANQNIIPTTTTIAATATTQNANESKHKLHKNGGQHNNSNATTTTTTTGATTPQHNTNGHANGYQNGLRRDSTQAWMPLLSNGNINADNVEKSNGVSKTNGDAGGVGVGVVLGGVVVKTSNALNDNGTLLYNCTPNNTNNNDLKATEDIKNLKNGLLHMPHHHHHHQQGNNNGSMMNGKNGHGLPDKYANEQDPLTGLYRKRASESDESDMDSDLNANDHKTPSCGLFGCRPSWARRFASTHVFMLVFLLAYILQGMYMTYFVSVITTIEKLFQIKSKTTGFLLSASEMGQISTAMLLTYFAGRGHRPRWIACGMVLFSVAAFACALPHFIFGDQLIQSNALLRTPRIKYTNAEQTLLLAARANKMRTNTGGIDIDLAALNATHGYDSSSLLAATMSIHDINLCRIEDNSTATGAECDEDRKMEQASHSKITVIVLCIFFASLLSSGIGQTAVATLGIPYIDDNVASKQSPMYMAITIGVRILGPASGFIVGSFCTRWYVNFTNPGFDPSDPRWIGAWWLGPVIIGSLMLLASIAMFSFPKQLRGKRSPNNEGNAGDQEAAPVNTEPEEKPKLKDFPKTVRRQLSNDILMFRTASCVFHLLPIAGLYTFLPKYLETQFRLATYDANMIAAFCGILVMGVGIVISGLVILKLKPSARSVAAWIALTALIYSAGMVILMFIGCNMNDFAGYKASTTNAPASIEPACSAALNCTCDRENFAPICGLDNKIYISACHAGCTTSERRGSDNRTAFSDCACIKDIDPMFSGESYVAVSGYCDVNCKNYIYFILIFVICVFIHSTSEVGSMLLVMRCTHPKDKAMAMGVIQSAIGLFGNVPCPIIYGAVVDSACLIWKSVCGKHGACSLYDADSFRNYFLGITAGIMFLAFIMDLIVFTKAHRIDIAPEEKTDTHKTMDNESAQAMAAPDTTV